MGRALAEGTIQVGIFHGHEFAWAKVNQPTLEPIVVCINPVRRVKAYLVGNARFNGTLQGASIALPRELREHCRLYFERRCVPAGTDPSTYYRKISRPAEPSDALDEVASGRVQLAVVDAVSVDRYQQTSPRQAQQLRALYQSEEFPPGVLAYDPARFPAADARKIQAALTAAAGHPRGRQSLQVLKLTAFEAPPADLPISLQAIAKAYPPDGRRIK